jgi:quercetin dioxygenase-like cupin family protein
VSHNRTHHQQNIPFCWAGIDTLVYKEEDGTAFKSVTRNVLFDASHGQDVEVRYFEVAAGGYTSLEKHEHTHLVIPIRGSGSCLIGDQVIELKQHDLAYVPTWAWHQFRASDNEELGFLCLVSPVRDRPTKPTPNEIAELKKNSAIAEFIQY